MRAFPRRPGGRCLRLRLGPRLCPVRGSAARSVVVGGLACVLLAAGCGSAASSQPGTGPPAASQAVPRRPAVTKILVIMEENHSIGQVFPAGMPYLWALARRFGRASSWSAVGHPSLPNYLAIFAGSAFNHPQDCAPAPGCLYPGPSVFGQALAARRTARAYQESMPARCATGGSGAYDVNHNPWAYFPGEARLCRAGDVPAGTTARGPLSADARAGSLPDVGLVTPDVNHDAHNGTLAAADAWLRSWLPVLMAGPDWRAGRLAIVVLFDEGQATQQVAFVLIARGVTGAVDRRPANHYALTRLIDEIAGTPLLRRAATAADIAPSLGLRLPHGAG